ncbi:hypothetical protein [Coprococcus comes]|uniref:hypothetical protein n=1 Tax=Coprococcus comes TaxID=410072 RepID=UPI0018985517|nr:hypothetical protein [Coprococcus comes]
MIGEDVKGKIWEVQAMCQNDSTYRGTAERQDFYFKSPLAKLEENEDEYSRCWVYLSDNFKNKLRSFLEHLNDDQGFKLPQENELTSYDNPEYLGWHMNLNIYGTLIIRLWLIRTLGNY